MDNKVALLVDLINDEKQYKKEHKEIFKGLNEKRKQIKSMKNEILALMDENTSEMFEGDYVFTRNKKRAMQHSMEILDEVIQQDGGVDEYTNRVSYEREYITHKKVKR